MSRIYEALQRADRDRQGTPVSEGNRVVEPISLPSIGAMPTLQSTFNFELIAQQAWHPSLPFLPALADRGAGVEQFRGLRSRLYEARYEAPVKTLLVSSGVPSEGKSFISVNLALSLSRSGSNRILLIDGDLRRPTLHTLLGAPNVTGLSDYLTGEADLKDILQRQSSPEGHEATSNTKLANLVFIPAGASSELSSELIANHRIEDLVAALSPHFDWIVIDSPPLLAVTDAVELAHAADAVLLVARGASTPYHVAQRAQSLLANTRILGFVLNDVKNASAGKSYYDYYYDSSETKHRGKGEKRGRREP